MGRDRTSRLAGLSLIEAIIAMAIVGILLAGVVPAFVTNLRVNTDSEIRTGAVAAAQTVLDQFRVLPKSRWQESGTTVAVVSHGRSFDVLVQYGAFCQDGTCYANSNLIQLEVSHGSRSRYAVSTVFTELPAGFFAPDLDD